MRPQPTTTLDPNTIPKFVNQLAVPPVFAPTVVTDPSTGHVVRHEYTVDVTEFYQQILPEGFPETKVWGYGGTVNDPLTGSPIRFQSVPGPTFEAVRGIPIQVTWQNKIDGQHIFPVDPTLHWADPNGMGMPTVPFPPYPPGFEDAQSPVPIVTHLHGGEVQSTSDGHPDAWFTSTGVQGAAYNTETPTTSDSAVFYYPNEQPPTTLWYHDHALGITRINVLSGLAGFYILKDPDDSLASDLPSGKYDIPLAIQDRSFNTDGSFYFPSVGNNPDVHPYWNPESFGNTIMVNGKVWPNLDVEPHQYRFRLLDGSNARFYTLSLSNNQQFIQIASDGGYLPKPVRLSSLTLAPGERAEILIDFSNLAPGTKITLTNSAGEQHCPMCRRGDPGNVGQVMQFTVVDAPVVHPKPLPTKLNEIPALKPDKPSRIFTLVQVQGRHGVEMMLLDGQRWGSAVSETPQVGSTEDWIFVNLTPSTHPIHLHLAQFQLVSRQEFMVGAYRNDWIAINGEPPLDHPTEVLPLDSYLKGKPHAPAANERGWKDTIQAMPGEVTTIRVRWAPLDAPVTGPSAPAPGVNLYPFDPADGPGYVWHCHILDHEDNEMMRPYYVTP